MQDNVEENSIIFEFQSLSKDLKLLKSTKQTIHDDPSVPWSMTNRGSRTIHKRGETESENDSTWRFVLNFEFLMFLLNLFVLAVESS